MSRKSSFLAASLIKARGMARRRGHGCEFAILMSGGVGLSVSGWVGHLKARRVNLGALVRDEIGLAKRAVSLLPSE